MEPDKRHYIRNAAAMRGRREADLTRDLPPDLAIEIDITSSLIDRLAIYAALGVPEVWRYDEETLRVCHLQPDGTYALAATSLSFPWLPITEVARFLDLHPDDGSIGLADVVPRLGPGNPRPHRPGSTRA